MGATVTFTVSGNGAGPELYRLVVRRADSEIRAIYDFRADNAFAWTPIDEGVYYITAQVMYEANTTITSTATIPYAILPIPISTSTAVITPTSHPLVARYSAPPCPVGASMQVVFFSPSAPEITQSLTNLKPCRSGRAMNLYVGGMRATTTYLMHHVILNDAGNVIASGADLPFRTGTPTIALPSGTIIDPIDLGTSNTEKLVLVSPIGSTAALRTPYAVDLLNGNFHFNSGISADFGVLESLSQEVQPDGTIVQKMQLATMAYRTQRMPDFYTLPAVWNSRGN